KMALKGALSGDLDFAFNKKATIKGQISYSEVSIDLPKYRLDTINSEFGSGDLDVTYSKETLQIAVNNAELSMDGFNVFGSFNLGGPKNERSVKLNIYTSPGDYMAIRRLVPYKLFKKKLRNRFEAFEVWGGKVEVESFKIEGPLKELKGKGLLRDDKTFSLVLGLQGINFKYPKFNDTFSEIYGRVGIRGPKITMEKLNGLYGKAKIDNLDGEVSGLTKRVTYKINLLTSLELSESLPEIKRLTRGKLDKLSGSGPAKITLHLSGGGGTSLSYSGKVDFLGTTLSHSSIPIERFSSTKGIVGFENGLIIFNNVHALSGGSELFINGTVENLSTLVPAYNLSLEGAIESIGLNSLLKDKLVKPIEYKYLLFYDVKVKGNKKELDIESTLDLSHIEIENIKGIRKAKGFPVLVKVTAKTKGAETTINRAILNIGTSAMELKGKVSFKPLSYSIEIPKSVLKAKDIDNISTLFIDDEWASGEIDFFLKAQRKKGTKKTLINGKANLRDCYLRSTLLKKQLEEVNLKAVFNGNNATITIDKMKIGASELTGRISLLDIKNQVVDFEMHSDYMESSDFILRESEPGKRKKKKKKSKVTGKGRINIKKGLLGANPFKAFNSTVVIDKDYLRMEPLIFSMSDGLISGNALYMKDPENETLFKTKLDIRSLNIETLVKGLGAKKKFISGKLNADLDLSGRRGVKIKNGLNGSISLASENGRLWKFPVITKIFSLVNIISISDLFDDGLRYNKITGTFNVTDGIFITEDLYFDSNSLRMSAYGKIDYAKDSIDATLGFHPFVTIDKIINVIPLAGWIISGKNQSTITMYYEIDGPLKNPDVMAVPVKSLGKGIFGIIERTLKLPGQALTPGKKEDEPAPSPAPTP
ncbi:MAG: AsmA-like C-terminal domain-containing protein, partial [Thermodesulfobacteriota bacterium]